MILRDRISQKMWTMADDFEKSWAIGIWFVVPFALVGYVSQVVAALPFRNAILLALAAGLIVLSARIIRLLPSERDSAALGEGSASPSSVIERETMLSPLEGEKNSAEADVESAGFSGQQVSKIDVGPAPIEKSPYELPSTLLLSKPPERIPFDADQLKTTAANIERTFEKFNIRGHVTQINPGPVVTTFEFMPEAGVKYSRIAMLSEDLCLGLQAESILIERIPGKPAVGIEVSNSNREVIGLRQILESAEFHASASPLTVALGKDINGRIKVAALDTMPHLLIAGSTGAGKSVMLNSLIMSILYKATPHQVRMIMVDPKRLEFGLYEGVPHLLTPVITDAKKAINALRNAVREMERRLNLLASQGVRNIDQYNKKIRQLQAKPHKGLFEDEIRDDELEEIPYVLILIDELADLMMLERANVEESVTRLAQMGRAAGMHLVLATQRPSVDVITGLIKANFPSRISFRVATRVDSRTVLDVMGAEHLLGRGDMLFLPPGSSRLVRIHGSFVSEAETNEVVGFWKQQAEPDYDKTFVLAPLADDEELSDAEFDGAEDPMYQDAVRVVLEMGKASTSTLQRRLRLGYGRAARILDKMQREGIIGPPDGSRPREVLIPPNWIYDLESKLETAFGTELDPLYADAMAIVWDIVGTSAGKLKNDLGIDDYWRAVDLIETIGRNGLPAKPSNERGQAKLPPSIKIRGSR
jgi:DNA segregation ATPase FtsK/SpoIIIE, S-DNA-T family